MNRTARAALLVALPLILLSMAFLADALPALPTEYYGTIITNGINASSGNVITAQVGGTTCASFTMQTAGGWGLLTCPHDDPTTPVVEGPGDGVEVQFFFNGENTTVIGGDNTTDSGEFKFVALSHPLPVCGDDFCDILFENNATCPEDCNIPGNQTNDTNQTTNGTGGGGGGGGSGGSGGGAGGGGSSSGGGGAGGAFTGTPFPGIIGALEGIVATGGVFGCQEEWVCTEWEECTIEGLQTRKCEDVNQCGTQEDKPAEVQECLYEPTCFDRIRNGDETGLDCGGSRCEPCPGCTNRIQDGDETGVDCGGSCRPCNSCFDGVQNYGETGVDCGGPCQACFEPAPPILEFPKIICSKSFNPLDNDAKWFLLIVLALAIARIFLYWKELRQIKQDQMLDEFKRAKKYQERRREMVLFTLVVVAICLLSYLYYYEFLLCGVGYQYLWAFLLVLLLVPFIIFSILRMLTYSDNRKLAALKKQMRSHEDILEEMLVFENTQLVEVEKEIAERIERVATDLEMVTELNKFPELKKIYEDIVTLYEQYHVNKTPTGIEKDLCDQVYAIETNEEFKNLARKYPDISVIYQKLALVYHHYEDKQKLYDELEKLEEQNKAKLEAKPAEQRSDDDLEGEDWENKGSEEEK